jgi:hypothetical protein
MVQQQLFPVGRHPRVSIENLTGSLEVWGWEESSIAVEAAGELPEISQEQDLLTIRGGVGDLTLRIPLGSRFFGGSKAITNLYVRRLSGHVSIEKARDVVLSEVSGGARVSNCAGNLVLEAIQEPVEVLACGDSLQARRLGVLRVRQGIGGDARLSELDEVDIDHVGGDLEVHQARRRCEVVTAGLRRTLRPSCWWAMLAVTCALHRPNACMLVMWEGISSSRRWLPPGWSWAT